MVSERIRITTGLILSPIGLLAAAVFSSLLLPGRDIFGDPGAGWHLLSGLRWLAGMPVVAPDPFSFAQDSLIPPQPIWIADQWLGDLTFAVVYSLLGFRGLEIFVAALISFSFFYLPGKKLAASAPDFFSLLLALLIAGSLGSIQWFFRPVIFTFFCFSYLLFIASPSISRPAVSKESRLPRPLHRPIQIAVLFILWCNLHPGFFVGLLYLFFRLFDKRGPRPGEEETAVPAFSSRLVDLVVAGLSTGVNPFGFRLHSSVLGLAQSDYFTRLNEEWLPPDLITLPYLLIVPVAVLICFSVLLRDKPWVARSDLAVSLLLLCLTIQQRRYAPLAGLASIRPLSAALGELLLRLGNSARLIRRIGAGLIEKERAHGLALVFPMLIAVYAAAAPFLGDPGAGGELRFGRYGFSERMHREVSAMRMSCVEEKGDLVQRRPCRLFASPDFGGLALWWLNLDPGVSVFIDDRNQFYGQKRYDQFFSIAGAAEGWQRQMDYMGIDLVYLNGEGPLRNAIASDSGWKEIYADQSSKAVIYGRK